MRLVNFLVLLVVMVVIVALAYHFSRGQSFIIVDSEQRFGFERVNCWFPTRGLTSGAQCYYMHVPENHAEPAGRVIRFPVVVFRSSHLFSSKPPVLHLGAGGPGAPMYLDSEDIVAGIYDTHNELSVLQGRDLFIIDPRGAGLAKPSLNCYTYVKNVTGYLAEDLSLEQELAKANDDYRACVRYFNNAGVEFRQYNSLSIARDIELMRQSAGVEQWVLLGVSYAAVYAQLIANEYPASVAAMILDSAAFPNIKEDDHYVERVMAPYRQLVSYCDIVEECETPLKNFEKRLWAVFDKLNDNPMTLTLPHPAGQETIKVVVNGARFMSAIFMGVYGVDIFNDIPRIVVQMEAGQTDAFRPYLESYLLYLYDEQYGDVSAEAHYCYENKPYTNFDLMKQQARESLPEGYIRDSTLLILDWPDLCQEMRITNSDAKVIQLLPNTIPTLFLHGKRDTVTLLSDVESQIEKFRNSQLVVFDLAHAILGSDRCAEQTVASFLDKPYRDARWVTRECQRSALAY